MPIEKTPPDFGPSTEQLDTAQNRDALPPGTMLGGHQIVDVLAADDFGIVYLALDQSLQRQTAIKEYLPAVMARRRADLQVALRAGEYAAAFNAGLAAFVREGETLARLNHPSLIDVTRTWEANGTAYRMMPFYSGQPLSTVLPTLAQPPDEPWVRRLLTDLLGALQTLHAASWQHLNVSPRQILLQPDGRPLLLGLGSVRRAIEAKKPASLRLDPESLDYAGPELSDTRTRLPVGPWSDLFGLAAVFHHLIVGRPPTPAALRLRGDRMPPLSTTVLTLAANYPGLFYSLELTGALTKALALNPVDRPQSVAAFQTSLDTPAPRSSAASSSGSGNIGIEAVSPGSESSSVEPIPRQRSALRWVVPLMLLGALGAGAWQWHRTGGSLPSLVSPQATATRAPEASVEPVVAPPPPPETEPAAAVVQSSPPTPVANPPAVAAATNEPTPQQIAATPPAPPPVARAPVARAAPTPPVRPAPERPPARAVAAAPAEPDNPRAVCGPRSNFSLTYCMETQCKRPKFQRHPQCLAMRQNGEIR